MGLQVLVYKDLQGLRTARDGSESPRRGLQVLVYKHLQALQIVPRILKVNAMEQHELGRFTTVHYVPIMRFWFALCTYYAILPDPCKYACKPWCPQPHR